VHGRRPAEERAACRTEASRRRALARRAWSARDPVRPPAGRFLSAGRPRYIGRMRYLGVDVGRVRIGLALSDDVLRTARPLRAVARRDEAATLADIGETIRAFEVGQLVVGLPLNMDGSEGPSARHARAFAGKLAAAFGLPAALHDERLSTFEAETRLRDQGFSGKDRRSRVDAEAAAVILQGWLERSER
jgi:putative holliday junction resolvase